MARKYGVRQQESRAQKKAKSGSEKNLKTGQKLRETLQEYDYKVGTVRAYAIPNRAVHICAINWSGRPQDLKKLEALAQYLRDPFSQGGIVIASALVQTGARLEAGHVLPESTSHLFCD